MSSYMNYRESPAFIEGEKKFLDQERAFLESRGYRLKNVSRPFSWVEEVGSIKDIRPEYELQEIKTGKRLMGMIDGSYYQAITAARQFVENRHHVHGRGFCGIDHPDGDGRTLHDACVVCKKANYIHPVSRLCKDCG